MTSVQNKGDLKLFHVPCHETSKLRAIKKIKMLRRFSWKVFSYLYPQALLPLTKHVTLGVVHCDSQTLGGLQCEHLIIQPFTTHNRVIRS